LDAAVAVVLPALPRLTDVNCLLGRRPGSERFVSIVVAVVRRATKCWL
jgi:hypothetical protein